MDTILVTGATGNVGAEILRLLQEQGQAVRVAVRSPKAARNSGADGVQEVAFDFAEPATYGAALNGVTRLFLMRPPQISNTKKYIDPVIDAAKQSGVQQIVLLSLLGAEKNPILPHRKIEQSILRSGIPYTFLRPSFFMQNLSTTHRLDIQKHNEVFVPAGHGATSFIDVRDIAAVAAKTLTEPGHAYRAYPLTGNEALTYDDVARTLTEALGRSIRYTNPSIGQFIKRYQIRGYALSFILVMIGIYTTARLGLAATVTPDTEQLLGRAPLTMRQFVQDYRECWL